MMNRKYVFSALAIVAMAVQADDLIYGIGADLQLARGLQLRAEHEVVDVEGADFNLFAASAVFHF